jgi:predicted polyphosphate/ATP-dependent NAD kinase
MTLKIGLIVNPIAGIGGRVGLKGSDGEDIQAQAMALGAEPLAPTRVMETLRALQEQADKIHWYTAAGVMGESLLAELGYSYDIIHTPAASTTRPEDTIQTAKKCQQAGVDLILFAGGDGTARNVTEAVKPGQLCLGIPAGCKIYSGVFSVTPKAAAEVIRQIVAGDLFQFANADVLDIDEVGYREGRITTRLYGDMMIPESAQYMQSVKESGRESEELVSEDIAAWMIEEMDQNTLYLIASGRICMAIKQHLGIDGTLLGVDAVLDQKLIKKDASEAELMELIKAHDGPVRLLLTPIGGQGILFGRGNHTVCHQVIDYLGMANTTVLASKSKLKSLNGRPLRLDTGDTELDQRLSGYIPIITGYDDQVIYQLAAL